MSEHVLHILGLSRSTACAAIVGDRAALMSLAGALGDALASGSGGLELYCSDGEPFHLAVVLEEEMAPLHTSYAGEIAPIRSAREQVAIQKLPRFVVALGKAKAGAGVRANSPFGDEPKLDIVAPTGAPRFKTRLPLDAGIRRGAGDDDLVKDLFID